MMPEDAADIVVVGGGPAGLGAATLLARAGCDVLLLERETEAGGVPRHCGHPPFGMREFGRVLAGPRYAARLVQAARAAGVRMATQHSVLGWDEPSMLRVATPSGPRRIAARRILLATGTRETTRAARLVPGLRPVGIMNTGALQAFACLEHRAPFRRPVIVGSELVALSAILTCRKLGIRPVAMIEESPRPMTPPLLALFPRLMGVPFHPDSRITDIAGKGRVSSVSLSQADGSVCTVDCDGVVFSGRFTPEASLARALGLALDPGTGGPEVDDDGRTSDPQVFAAGNLLRPVETAGHCWQEGRRIAERMLEDLRAGGPEAGRDAVPVQAGKGLRWVMPQKVLPGRAGAMTGVQLRLAEHGRGWAEVMQNGQLILRRRVSGTPETRITLPLTANRLAPTGAIQISFRGQ
ncbi:NAD(P)/FAD-dependent oxidoreductase [Plastorhodobacter daqingensis]|uniref:NAD(P)/FAD-dependent oxidoreductase n=1 Tax=Plastorhodobacter daqingensis TaxID=1387281 RepID=A0ABW2UNR7_9RHOB